MGFGGEFDGNFDDPHRYSPTKQPFINFFSHHITFFSFNIVNWRSDSFIFGKIRTPEMFGD